MPATLKIELLDCRLSVCRYAEVPEGLPREGFLSVTRTGDEVSVVCETGRAPSGPQACEDGWSALKVLGPLDFSLVGILAGISTMLAEAGIPLFALSTYDTDYILVKEGDLRSAIEALRAGGCEVAP